MKTGLSPQEYLWHHWERSAERLKALASSSESGPPLLQLADLLAASTGPQEVAEILRTTLERAGEARATVERWGQIVARMRRIEGYLSYERPASNAPTMLEAVKAIRPKFDKGDCDEAIALFLENFLTPTKKRGRPRGATVPGKVALLALQLHKSDRSRWTWPKLADQVLNCPKGHMPHPWDSPCTSKLKQAVARLSAFLKELEADPDDGSTVI